MKNFIYLPILAFIFLSSCKSSSFTTQRYTRLGHASHKNSSEQVSSVHKNKESKNEEFQPAVLTLHNQQTEPAYALAAQKENVKQPSNAFTFPKKVIRPLLNAGKAGVSWVKSDVKTSQPQKIESKKTFKEKMQRASGLFATTVRLVLFCVVVVVVVAAVIICLIVFG